MIISKYDGNNRKIFLFLCPDVWLYQIEELAADDVAGANDADPHFGVFKAPMYDFIVLSAKSPSQIPKK